MGEYPEICPSCGEDLRDPNYPGFYRTIGRYDQGKDRVTKWKCPDCGHEWNRE